MSQIQIDDIDLHYESYGDKGKPVILLHGWGQNTEMMAFIGEFLKSHFIVYNLDMPGFGKSGDPKEAWGSFEYCQFLRHFCETMQIEDPIIIGHSFGCRIAIQYAVHYPVHRMVLTGAASEIIIGSISSEVARKIAISVPREIVLPAYRFEAAAEKPH